MQRDLPREHGFEPMRVSGTMPVDLSGTLFRVGPALFSTFGRPYGHWFDGDGDGAVSAERFADGRAAGAVKHQAGDALLATGRLPRRHCRGGDLRVTRNWSLSRLVMTRVESCWRSSARRHHAGRRAPPCRWWNQRAFSLRPTSDGHAHTDLAQGGTSATRRHAAVARGRARLALRQATFTLWGGEPGRAATEPCSALK
jgi:hypothetical protein